MKKVLIVLLISLIVISCNSNNAKYSENYNLAYESDVASMDKSNKFSAAPAIAGNVIQETTEIKKKIIRDANIGVEVDDYKSFRVKIDSVVKTLNGYISNDNLYNNDASITCNINIRLPEKNLDRFLAYLENGEAKTLYKNISTQDVTEEFIDIEARLKNKMSIEKRYSQLLNKANTVTEILEIEEKLRIVREEIESTQGRLSYLNSLVAYSTINLMVTQNIDYKYQPSKSKNFFQLLIKSLDRGWAVFLQFLLFLVKLWPFIIILVMFVFVYFRYWKPKKERKHKRDK